MDEIKRCLICRELFDTEGDICHPCQAAQAKPRSRGGRRIPGPGKTIGRPPKDPAQGKRRRRSYRFTPWLADWLDSRLGDETELVEQAIINYYRLSPPE